MNSYLPILFDCINENISPGVFTISAYMCLVCVLNEKVKSEGKEGCEESKGWSR